MNRSLKFTAILVVVLLVFAVCYHFWGDMPWFAPLSLVSTAGILPLGATFLGATYAFEYQNNEANKKERRSQIVAGQLAAFNLSELHNDILNIDLQILSKHRGNPVAFIEMPPSPDIKMSKASVDFTSLYFLLDDDGYKLLQNLSVCLAKYNTLIGAIDTRSKIHANEAQPLAEQSGIAQGGDYTEEEIEAALGPNVSHQLKSLTEDLFEESEDTLTFMENTSEQLTDTLEKRFPESSFPCITPRSKNPIYQDKLKRVNSERIR